MDTVPTNGRGVLRLTPPPLPSDPWEHIPTARFTYSACLTCDSNGKVWLAEDVSSDCPDCGGYKFQVREIR